MSPGGAPKSGGGRASASAARLAGPGLDEAHLHGDPGPQDRPGRLTANVDHDLEGPASGVDRRADEPDLSGGPGVRKAVRNDLDRVPDLDSEELLLGQVDARQERLDGGDLEQRVEFVLDHL